MRLLSDAALVIGVEALRELNLPRIPAVPLSRLISTDQHDSVLVGVEGEQESHAAIDSRLLELANSRSVDHIDVRTPKGRPAVDDPRDRTANLRVALRVQRS
jgi:hypothetical protein